MNTRLFLLPLLIVTVILLVPTSSSATQSDTVWVWCLSDLTPTTIYYTPPFDSGMNAKSTFNGRSLGRQFGEYVEGRFDVKGTAGCHRGRSGDQASALQSMEENLSSLRQMDKQLVEVRDWKYVRDNLAIKGSFKTGELPPMMDTEGGLPDDHFYCVAGPANNTIYYADVIPLPTPTNVASVAYLRFLQQNYAFQGEYTCYTANEPHAKLYLNARLAGARAGGKQVVNTGWPTPISTTTP